MEKQELLNKIAQFSDFEAQHYLNLWNQDQTPNNLAPVAPRIAPNKIITQANAGDLARLALLTIVAESASGENWLRQKCQEVPYLGEAKNFSKENARSLGEVMMVLSGALAFLGTDIKFAVNGGKIDFSLSFGAMSNPLLRDQFKKVLGTTAWFNAKTADPVVVMLTPIEVERQAVLAQLPEWVPYFSPVTHTQLSESVFEGIHHRFKIYNQLSSSGLIETATAIESIAHEIKPDLVLMVGVAGGVKDVQKGDLVIGERAYGYERGKQTDAGFVARPQVFNYTHRLIQLSRWVMDQQTWLSRIVMQKDFPSTDTPKIIFGPIASGNKVIASEHSELVRFLKQHYNDTLAVEMEAIAFLPLLRHERIMSLNIRGISDLLGDKALADAQNHQPLAAARAAAFAFELLKNLDLKDMIQS